METRVHLLICGLVAVYLSPSSGQSYEYPTLFYRDMTNDFDVRLRGSFRTPICVRLMMNCWEVMSGGNVCSEQGVYFASACTSMRSHRCTDLYQWGQYGYPLTSSICMLKVSFGEVKLMMKITDSNWNSSMTTGCSC